MAKQTIIIEVYPTYWRAALLSGRTVRAVDLVMLAQQGCLGDQYVGRVVNVDKGRTFVDIGLDRPGLLKDIKSIGAVIVVEVTREALEDSGEDGQKKAVRLRALDEVIVPQKIPSLIKRGKHAFEGWLASECQVIVTSRRLLEDLEARYPHCIYEYCRLEESPFNVWGIETVWDTLDDRKRILPSGGELIFERTAVGLMIDINEGQSNIFKANFEACYEVARQLFLRGEGGNMIIDFPYEKGHTKKIDSWLAAAFAEWKIHPKKNFSSPMGWYELRLEWRRQPMEQKLREIEKC